MEMHEIRYFLSVERERNFTRAAQASNVSQPALTRAVRKLEAELGGALFHRGPGGIELTSFGRTLLPRLQQIDRDVAEVKSTAVELVRGQLSILRLGVMCTVGPYHLVDILTRLRGEAPDAQVVLVEAKADKVVDLLLADELDVAIAAWPSYPASVSCTELMSERYAVLCPATHPFAALERVPLERLAEQPYLERLNCEFDDFYLAQVGKWTLDLDVAFASEREDWIQALVRSGMGCAIVPEFIELHEGLVTRPLARPQVKREIGVLTINGRIRPPIADRLIEIAVAHRWTGRRRD